MEAEKILKHRIFTHKEFGTVRLLAIGTILNFALPMFDSLWRLAIPVT